MRRCDDCSSGLSTLRTLLSTPSIRNIADQITVHQLGLAAARQDRTMIGERWAYGHLGEAYQACPRYDEAITRYLHALAIAERIDDKFGQAAPLQDLGYAYVKLRQF